MLLGAFVGDLASAQRLYPTLQLDKELAIQEDDSIERILTETTSITPNQKATEDLVQDLPGLDPAIILTQHAGRIPLLDNGTSNIFYWHFQAAQNADQAPLVIWLNGGPGCSSLQGLFLGISPLNLSNDMTIGKNEHSWHAYANLLFVDQPVGTGMSYTKGDDYRSDEKVVAIDFYNFLTKFLQRHPVYLSDGDDQAKHSRALYFFGESHAGRWIPELSEYILKQNGNPNNRIKINLNGIGIGNGWVHPRVQYEYSDYAHGIGLLTFGQVRSLKASYTECLDALDAGTYMSRSCLKNMDDILNGIKLGKGGRSLNFYDVRQYVDNVRGYPFEMDTIVKYMNKVDVRRAVHGNEDKDYRFNICSNKVYKALSKFDGVSTLNTISSLLQKGLRVLFYNGQWDMMCNHYGTEKLLFNLEWNGSDAYQEAHKYTWRVQGRQEPAGFAQQGGNLTFLVVAGAGHVVPLDVPDVAADMLYRFVNKLAFNDVEQTVANTRLKATDLESSYCYPPARTSATNTSFTQSGDKTRESHAGIAWLWVLLGITAASSILVLCITIACLRRKRYRRLDQEKIAQISDEENLNDEDEEKRSDNGDDIAENCVSQRAPSPRSRVVEA